MKIKTILVVLSVLQALSWMLLGALLVEYYDIDITSKLKLIVGA
jgi:hypothetical protein